MTDRIKSAEDLPRAFQESVSYGNGSCPPSVGTPEEFGELVDLARRKLPERAQNSPNSTGGYTQKAVYPEDSILADWVRIARQHEESADAFIIGSILPVCGALLGRRVWIQWGEKQKFANCFTMLAGKPGDRKSSIIDLAEMLARQILPGNAFFAEIVQPRNAV